MSHPNPTDTVTVMSYNVWKNHAAGELADLEARHPVDILCVQEAKTRDLPSALGDLRLTASTRNNRLGLAIYSRSSRFTVRKTATFALDLSMHDRLLGPTPERLVAAFLTDESTGADFVAASFHAAPLSASNGVRRRQITAAHRLLGELGEAAPILMIGDFNYPWFAGKLATTLAPTGFTLSRGAASTYRRFPVYRGTFDIVTSTGFEVAPITTLPQGLSDHFPVIARATVSRPVAAVGGHSHAKSQKAEQ